LRGVVLAAVISGTVGAILLLAAVFFDIQIPEKRIVGIAEPLRRWRDVA